MFAGLRTLTLAYRELDEDEYDAWEKDYHNAEILVDGREDAMDEISARIETNLTLLGATAIEDKLQDGVPETIAKLKRAGIKIWVATGDRLETAIGESTIRSFIPRSRAIADISLGLTSDRHELQLAFSRHEPHHRPRWRVRYSQLDV
jgi:haloacid dehalogenase-like hydrolase